MKNLLINFIAVFCILVGLVSSVLWLAPVPLSAWGGIDRFRNVSTALLFIGSLLIFLGIMMFRKTGQAEKSDVVSQKATGKRKVQFAVIYWTIVTLLIGYNFVHLDNLYRRDISIRQQMQDDYCKNPVKGYECFESKR